MHSYRRNQLSFRLSVNLIAFLIKAIEKAWFWWGYIFIVIGNLTDSRLPCNYHDFWTLAEGKWHISREISKLGSSTAYVITFQFIVGQGQGYCSKLGSPKTSEYDSSGTCLFTSYRTTDSRVWNQQGTLDMRLIVEGDASTWGWSLLLSAFSSQLPRWMNEF